MIFPWGEWVIAHKAQSSALTIKSDSITASFERLLDNADIETLVKHVVIAANLRVGAGIQWGDYQRWRLRAEQEQDQMTVGTFYPPRFGL